MTSDSFLCFFSEARATTDVETWVQSWEGGREGAGGGSDMLNCHSGVDVSCMFQCFVWNWAEVMSKVGVQPPPRPRATGEGSPTFPGRGFSEGGRGGRYSLMHNCLLRALNGCGP